MKKGISVILTVILMMSLIACGGDVNQRVNRRYRNLQSYTARVKVTVTGNKGQQVYQMSQSFRAPDQYRIEILAPERMQGTVCVISGRNIWMRSAGDLAIQMEQGFFQEEKDYLFLQDFLTDYFDREELPELTVNQEGRILLSAPRRGDSKYRFSQNLEIDKSSNLPKFLITYDEDGSEVVRVEYENFEPEAEIADSVFLP